MSRSYLRTSEDNGAPTLTNTAGSLNTLLKAVLVDGYGSTPSLGWSLWDEDLTNRIAVFRPGSSSGISPFVQIQDNTADYYYAYVRVYESMSSLTDGISPTPQLSVTSYNAIFKCAENGEAIRWKIIGDDRGFWLLTQPWNNAATVTDIWEPHYIGEWTPYNRNNKHAWMFIGHSHNNSGEFRSGQSTCSFLMRDPETFEIGSLSFTPHARFVYQFGIDIDYNNTGKINGRNFYDPIMIRCNDNYIIGQVPGLFHMCYQPEGGSYTLNAEERQPFSDVISDDALLLTLPARYTTNAQTSIIQRFTYLIGEGFRDAH